jgi:rRNA maturation endonuclease Nob1
MISTEINILDFIQLSEQDIDIITLEAKQDAERKIESVIQDDFDITTCNISFELICKVTIKTK